MSDKGQYNSRYISDRSAEQPESDLKKRVEYLEKECKAAKTMAEQLEAQNDTLSDDIKRLQLKAVKRMPLTPQENVYVENQILQDKVKRLEKRFKDSTQKLKAAESLGGSGGSAGDREAEIHELKNKVNELQGNTEDMKKLVSGARIPKVPKDTTPKATLVKWVNELENECSK